MTSDGYYITDMNTEWESALARHKIREKKHREVAEDVLDTKAYWEQTEINKHQHENKTLKELDAMQDEIEEVLYFPCISNVKNQHEPYTHTNITLFIKERIA